jgi:hypothetical protein
MQTVSQAYLLGIREGRALLRQFERDGIAGLDTARGALENSRECLAMGFSGDMREAMKGERDFWAQQV